MSSMQQSVNAGQTQDQTTKVNADQWMASTKEIAQAATDQGLAAANPASETAQQKQEEAAGFFQQTGEQVKNLAQEAVDSVKQTLGMDKN